MLYLLSMQRCPLDRSVTWRSSEKNSNNHSLIRRLKVIFFLFSFSLLRFFSSSCWCSLLFSSSSLRACVCARIVNWQKERNASITSRRRMYVMTNRIIETGEREREIESEARCKLLKNFVIKSNQRNSARLKMLFFSFFFNCNDLCQLQCAHSRIAFHLISSLNLVTT